MKTIKLYSAVLFSIVVAACGGGSSNEGSSAATAPVATATTAKPNLPAVKPPKVLPPEPYSRLLPLQLKAPATAQTGIALEGISVNLANPGDEAPNARLRLIIHAKDHSHAAGLQELNPDNVKVEVEEAGVWKQVLLGMVEGGVMGAIGTEGATAHRERHRRGGFAIPAGMDKTWNLRVTFGVPGIYTLVSAVSPNNGSMHLAQPAHTTIEVK
ncbi:MAG: hypothetical protein OEV35_08945 [Gallionellaceae bacterium]|nr:hypothetical protein [Gallionellaceae bacterium]